MHHGQRDDAHAWIRSQVLSYSIALALLRTLRGLNGQHMTCGIDHAAIRRRIGHDDAVADPAQAQSAGRIPDVRQLPGEAADEGHLEVFSAHVALPTISATV